MPIPNFSNLLNDALNGDDNALVQWAEHTKKADFNADEITLATEKIDTCLRQDNAPKSFAFYLKGLWCQFGIDTEKNYLEAIRLFEEAIKQGNAYAMNHRAYMHMHGLGGDKNYPEAIRLFEEAIKQGHAAAMSNRACMHEQGLGGERNYPEAIRLYEKARELGYPVKNKCEELDRLEKKQQAKERLKSALEPYQINFEQLLGQLRNTRDSLTQQALTNSSYETVSSRVSELYNTLENEMGIFFANPSMRKFQQCHDLCTGVIERAAEEAAQHRGWHAIDPIIRGILGVLAALTVLPALIVQATSKHGYLQTFFAKPVTTTSEQITAFAVQQNEINEGINLILAP